MPVTVSQLPAASTTFAIEVLSTGTAVEKHRLQHWDQVADVRPHGHDQDEERGGDDHERLRPGGGRDHRAEDHRGGQPRGRSGRSLCARQQQRAGDGDDHERRCGGPAPDFSPENGATVTDAATNITLTFAEAITRRTASNTEALTDADLAGILTLTRTDSSGAAIAYSATIDSAKKVITIDPTANLPEGPVYVAISNAHYDALGNQGALRSATFTVDTVAPTLTIGGVPAAINATDDLNVSFTFSEDVTGFDTDDVTVTGGSKGAFSGSAKSYALAVTPAGSADVVVTVRANAATDGANQGPASPATATAAWDATGPAAPDFSPENGTTVTDAATNITLTFDEPLRKTSSGTALADADLAGILTLTRTDSSGAAIAYSATIDSAKKVITIDPTANLPEGPVYVAISNAHYDALGNQGALRSATFTVDTVAPTLTIGGVPAAINATDDLNVSFTFSEDVTGFDTDDVTVTGGSKGAFSGSAKSYALAVTPAGSADVVVTVRANAATDGANQGPASPATATAAWDATGPRRPISARRTAPRSRTPRPTSRSPSTSRSARPARGRRWPTPTSRGS